MREAPNVRTICEVLRDINDQHQEKTDHDQRVRDLLLVAERMAKRMANKLLEYNKEVFKDWWEKNPDHEKKLRARMSKSYLATSKKW